MAFSDIYLAHLREVVTRHLTLGVEYLCADVNAATNGEIPALNGEAPVPRDTFVAHLRAVATDLPLPLVFSGIKRGAKIQVVAGDWPATDSRATATIGATATVRPANGGSGKPVTVASVKLTAATYDIGSVSLPDVDIAARGWTPDYRAQVERAHRDLATALASINGRVTSLAALIEAADASASLAAKQKTIAPVLAGMDPAVMLRALHAQGVITGEQAVAAGIPAEIVATWEVK